MTPKMLLSDEEMKKLEELRKQTPNPKFCRKPEICSKTHKCYAIEKYDRSCND